MALSDSAIRKAKPADKPLRLFDGGGLYLEISPSGGKLWRLKYRFAGNEKRLENDVFPWIRAQPIADTAPPEVLKVLNRIEGRGAHDTAHRALQNWTGFSLRRCHGAHPRRPVP